MEQHSHVTWQKHKYIYSKQQTILSPARRPQNKNISSDRPCHQLVLCQTASSTKTPPANFYPSHLHLASFYLPNHHPLPMTLSLLRAVPAFCLSTWHGPETPQNFSADLQFHPSFSSWSQTNKKPQSCSCKTVLRTDLVT